MFYCRDGIVAEFSAQSYPNYVLKLPLPPEISKRSLLPATTPLHNSNSHGTYYRNAVCNSVQKRYVKRRASAS